MRSRAVARAHSTRRGASPAPLATALLLCAALGGCAGGIQSAYTTGLWVEPGKYEFLKCPDLARQSVALSSNEAKLVSLMERANQDVAGSIINAGVYQAQLEQTRAQIELVQRTAREKGCDSLVPPAKK